jgi:hypothetical protein
MLVMKAVMINFTKIFFDAMKNIIDILAIALPALIILLGFVRLFSNNQKRNFNGLIMFIAILLLLVGLIRNVFFSGKGTNEQGTKELPLIVSKHSADFNNSLENILKTYFEMTEAFSKDDTSAIHQSGFQLKVALDSFNLDELKKDTLIYQTALDPLSNANAEIVAILSDPSIVEKRASLNIFSDELFTFLRTVHYDVAKLYWQECSSAFGEDKSGFWISKEEKSPNPYRIDNCAVVKTTINFIPADSTKH